MHESPSRTSEFTRWLQDYPHLSSEIQDVANSLIIFIEIGAPIGLGHVLAHGVVVVVDRRDTRVRDGRSRIQWVLTS